MNDNKSGFTKTMLLTLLIGVVVGMVALAVIQNYRASSRNAVMWAGERFGMNNPVVDPMDEQFTDANGDLVPDAPPADKCMEPDTLYFSFIPSAETENSAASWQPLMDALAQGTGKSVEYKSTGSVKAQLEALSAGDIHIVGLNTGTVPRAVNHHGFIPVGAMGRDDGSFGTTVKIIVPADSPIQSAKDLKGKLVTFTSTSSNSGFKAPVVLLKEEFSMEPDRDYSYAFSNSHGASIRGVCAHQIVAACVASDLLDKIVADEQLDENSYRVIYTSQRFPSAAFGHVYNLKPELANSIREVLVKFEFPTEMRNEFGTSGERRFVAVSYRDDWDLIRGIDAALGSKFEDIEAATTADDEAEDHLQEVSAVESTAGTDATERTETADEDTAKTETNSAE